MSQSGCLQTPTPPPFSFYRCHHSKVGSEVNLTCSSSGQGVVNPLFCSHLQTRSEWSSRCLFWCVWLTEELTLRKTFYLQVSSTRRHQNRRTFRWNVSPLYFLYHWCIRLKSVFKDQNSDLISVNIFWLENCWIMFHHFFFLHFVFYIPNKLFIKMSVDTGSMFWDQTMYL